MGEEGGHDCAKGAIKLCAILGGCHEVERDGVLGGSFHSIKNESFFLALLYKVVLCGEEYMRCEPGNPRRERDDVAITLFLVHCGHNLLAFLVNGRVVSHAPVKEGIIA